MWFGGMDSTGSGPFSGTLAVDGSVMFTDTATDGSGFTIIWSGFLFPDGSLSGSYTTSGVYGIWQTTPENPSAVTSTSTPSTPVLTRPGAPFLDDPMTGPNNKNQWMVSNQPWASCSFGNGGYDVKVPAGATVNYKILCRNFLIIPCRIKDQE